MRKNVATKNTKNTKEISEDLSSSFLCPFVVNVLNKNLTTKNTKSAKEDKILFLYPFSCPFVSFVVNVIKLNTISYECDGRGSEKSSEKIVDLLRADPTMTIAALAEALSLSTRAVEKAIKKLQEAGRIQRIGPAKGGRWSVPESGQQ